LLPAHLRDEAACLHEAIATEAKQRVNDCLPQHTRVKKPPGDTFSARGVDVDSESWLTLRAMLPLPGPCAPLMKMIGCELVLEDHDLHHRNGWRMSGNYGKVTRLWDRIFGTCMDRIESNWDNVDYSEPIVMPWL
jgi:hypothetical protein